MAKEAGSQKTFVVRVVSTQNATWQGTVTWTDGRESQPFRSALELMKLIDSTLKDPDNAGQ